MSDFSCTIDGTTYQFRSQNVYDSYQNAIKDCKTDDEKLVVMQEYIDRDAVKAVEDDLQTLDIGDEAKSDEIPQGFNYDQYSNYASSVGLSDLTDDSSIDDLIAVFDQIEKEVNELEKKIASLDTDDPDKLAQMMDEIVNMSVAIGELGDKAGAEFSKKGVWSKIGIGAAAGAGVAAGAMVGTGVAVGGIATLAEVATVASLVPFAGWAVAAGCLAAGGIWAGVSAYSNSKNQKKLDQLKEDLDAANTKVNDAYDKASGKISDSTKTLVDEASSALKDFMGDSFEFDDVTDLTSVTKNIDTILEWQNLLEPYYELCQNYGIDVEGLDELMAMVGSGDKRTLAQNYLDAYADQVSLDITDEVISDTTTLNTLYADIEDLIETAKDKGLDTTKLEKLLKTIQTTNQQEADTAAANVTTTGDDVETLVNASGGAADTASGVNSGSTAYTTDTKALSDASSSALKTAQSNVDAYLASISTDGLSLTQLESLYNEVSSKYSCYQALDSDLDLSGFETVLSKIRQAQQTIIDNTTSSTKSCCISSSNHRNETRSYSKKQKNDSDKTNSSHSTTTTTVSLKVQLDAAALILDQAKGSSNVDTSELERAIADLSAKIAELETESTTNNYYNYTDNSSMNIDNSITNNYYDNSITNSYIDNSDNSYTDNSYTDNSITNNSTAEELTEPVIPDEPEPETPSIDNPNPDVPVGGTEEAEDPKETDKAEEADKADECEEEDEVRTDMGSGLLEEAESAAYQASKENYYTEIAGSASHAADTAADAEKAAEAATDAADAASGTDYAAQAQAAANTAEKEAEAAAEKAEEEAEKAAEAAQSNPNPDVGIYGDDEVNIEVEE